MDKPVYKRNEPGSAIELLGKSIARLADKDELTETSVPGLSLYRKSEPTRPNSAIYDPCICLSVQGAKRVVLGSEEYVYDAQHYLITPINLPTIVQILDASPEKPFFALILKLDLRSLAELMVDSKLPQPQIQPGHAMATGRVTLPLLDAFQRLVSLLDSPGTYPYLRQ